MLIIKRKMLSQIHVAFSSSDTVLVGSHSHLRTMYQLNQTNLLSHSWSFKRTISIDIFTHIFVYSNTLNQSHLCKACASWVILYPEFTITCEWKEMFISAVCDFVVCSILKRNLIAMILNLSTENVTIY